MSPTLITFNPRVGSIHRQIQYRQFTLQLAQPVSLLLGEFRRSSPLVVFPELQGFGQIRRDPMERRRIQLRQFFDHQIQR